MDQNKTVYYLLFGGLMAWGIYRRVRRNIGRQPLRPRRIIVRLILLGVFSLSPIIAGLYFPQLLPSLPGYGIGILAGAFLGFVSLRLTRFETTDEGHFYKPDTRIGVALSMLLVGRMIYRFSFLSDATKAPNHPPALQSPLTFFIYGLTIGYYIVYSVGLFVHAYDKNKQQNVLAAKDPV